MNRNYSKIRHIQETNLKLEQRRFNQLLESTMGDVKPLVNEGGPFDPTGDPTSTEPAGTTPLQAAKQTTGTPPAKQAPAKPQAQQTASDPNLVKYGFDKFPCVTTGAKYTISPNPQDPNRVAIIRDNEPATYYFQPGPSGGRYRTKLNTNKYDDGFWFCSGANLQKSKTQPSVG